MIAEGRYGIIEIGSRGIRLLVADLSFFGIDSIVYSTGDLSHLGQEADEDGNLSQKSMARVITIARRYLAIAQEHEAKEIFVIATEIIRNAPNRAVFEKVINTITPVRILTEKEEAVCSFIASADCFHDVLEMGETMLVIDQGGGSTEMSYGSIGPAGVSIKGVAKLDLGTIRLNRLLTENDDLGAGFQMLEEEVANQLVNSPNFADLLETPPTFTVGLGSAIMIFMRGILRQERGYEPSLKQLHGENVETGVMTHQINATKPSLANASLEDLGLTAEDELITLMTGTVTYHALLKQYRIKEITVSRNGMRFGALLWLAGFDCEILV